MLNYQRLNPCFSMMNLLTTVKNRQERFTAVSRLSAADAKTTAAVGFPRRRQRRGHVSGGGLTSLGIVLGDGGILWDNIGYGYGSIPTSSTAQGGDGSFRIGNL